jgi:hypothetical protein
LPASGADYRFVGLPYNKFFGKVVESIQRDFRPNIDSKMYYIESMKNRVYRQVVEEIEEKYFSQFSALKTAFCAKYGVALL